VLQNKRKNYEEGRNYEKFVDEKNIMAYCFPGYHFPGWGN
jgi:hypothetical protein